MPAGSAGRCAGDRLLVVPSFSQGFFIRYGYWYWILSVLSQDQPLRARSEQGCTAGHLHRAPDLCTTDTAHNIRSRCGANQSRSLLGRSEHAGRWRGRVPDAQTAKRAAVAWKIRGCGSIASPRGDGEPSWAKSAGFCSRRAPG